MNSTETKKTHTPGPWELIDDGQAWPHVHAEYLPHGTICEMSSHDPQDEGNGDRARNRALANARLIAAAPETTALLAEIRLAYEAKDEWKLRDALAKVPVVLEKAGVPLAAIAKSEGR